MGEHVLKGTAYPNDADLFEWNESEHPVEPESIDRGGNCFGDARRQAILRDAPMEIGVDRAHGLDQRGVLSEGCKYRGGTAAQLLRRNLASERQWSKSARAMRPGPSGVRSYASV